MIFDPCGCELVEVGRYNFLVIQRHHNPQHLFSSGNKSPIGYRFARALSVFANAPDYPIFQGVLDPAGCNVTIGEVPQMPGQPSGDAARRDGLRQSALGVQSAAGTRRRTGWKALVVAGEGGRDLLVGLLRGAGGADAELHRRVLDLGLHGQVDEDRALGGKHFADTGGEVFQVVE